MADHRKNSRQLGDQWHYVPIEVLPMAWAQEYTSFSLSLWTKLKKSQNGLIFLVFTCLLTTKITVKPEVCCFLVLMPVKISLNIVGEEKDRGEAGRRGQAEDGCSQSRSVLAHNLRSYRVACLDRPGLQIFWLFSCF